MDFLRLNPKNELCIMSGERTSDGSSTGLRIAKDK